MFHIRVFPSLHSLPAFPSRFSLPSFPSRSSQWCLWLIQVPFFPSLCIPFPPLPFPLFLSLFPCWRSYSLPCSLLTIMFPPSFPIFDYAPTPFPYFWLCPDTLCPDVLMLLLQDCWKCNFCAVSAWVYGPDNYYLCTKLYSKSATLFSAGVPPWNNECSRPLKNGCSSPPRKWVLEPPK